MDSEEVDPNTLLEWLDGSLSLMDEERSLQASALERLCMLLLMSSNVDRCLDSYSPDVFIPALCHIFLDISTPIHILEIAARALTYFLDVSMECAYKIATVEGSIHAIASKLQLSIPVERNNVELAEQCIKILDHMCSIDTDISMAGQFIINLLSDHWSNLHEDSIKCANDVLHDICKYYKPSSSSFDMRQLFKSTNQNIVSSALTNLPFLYRQNLPVPDNLPDSLFDQPNLLSIICRRANNIDIKALLNCCLRRNTSLDIRLADVLLYLLFEKNQSKQSNKINQVISKMLTEPNQLIKNLSDHLFTVDNHGYNLLCWAAALDHRTHIDQLIQEGADPSSAIHIAAIADKLESCRLLLEAGADYDLPDDNGSTAYSLANERMKYQSLQVLQLAPVFWNVRTNLQFDQSYCSQLSIVEIAEYFDALFLVDFNQSVASLRLLLKLLSYCPKQITEQIFQMRPQLASHICEILSFYLGSGRLRDEATYLTLRICLTLIEKHPDYFEALFLRLGLVERFEKLKSQQNDIEMLDISEIMFLPTNTDRHLMLKKLSTNLSNRCKLTMRVLKMKPFAWNHWKVVVLTDFVYLFNNFIAIELYRSSIRGSFSIYVDNRIYRFRPQLNRRDSVDYLDSFIQFLDRFYFAQTASTLAAPLDTTKDSQCELIGPWSFVQKDDESAAYICHNNTKWIDLYSSSNNCIFVGKSPNFNINGIVKNIRMDVEKSDQSKESSKKIRASDEVKDACMHKRSYKLCDCLFAYFQMQIQRNINSKLPIQELNNIYLNDLYGHANIFLDLLANKKFTRFELISSRLSECLLSESAQYFFNNYIQHPGIDVLIETYMKQLDDELTNLSDLWPLMSTCSQGRSSRYSLKQLSQDIRLKLAFTPSPNKNQSDWIDDHQKLIYPTDKPLIISTNQFICIDQLCSQLEGKFICSWYHDQRSNIYFVKEIERMNIIELNDRNGRGIIEWIATNAMHCTRVDPLKANLMKMVTSKRKKLSSKYPSYRYILKSDTRANSDRRFFQLDTGLYIRPTSFVITQNSSDGKLKRPFNWILLLSADSKNWSKVDIESSENIQKGVFYSISPILNTTDIYQRGCRFLRFEQPNFEDDNFEFIFDLDNFELFGTIIGVCKTLTAEQSINLHTRTNPTNIRHITDLLRNFRSFSRENIDFQLQTVEAMNFRLQEALRGDLRRRNDSQNLSSNVAVVLGTLLESLRSQNGRSQEETTTLTSSNTSDVQLNPHSVPPSSSMLEGFLEEMSPNGDDEDRVLPSLDQINNSQLISMILDDEMYESPENNGESTRRDNPTDYDEDYNENEESEDDLNDCENDDQLVDYENAEELEIEDEDNWRIGSHKPTMYFFERESKAIVAAYDPRPGHFNQSTTYDIDEKTISLHGKQSEKKKNNQTIRRFNLFVELCEDSKMDIPMVKRQIPSDDTRCILWHLRKIVSEFKGKQRNFLSKALMESSFKYDWSLKTLSKFRLNVQFVDKYEIGETFNDDKKMEPRLDECAQILKQLYSFRPKESIFHHPRFATIVKRVLNDPASMASNSFPIWIDKLIKSSPFILPLDDRISYFRALAFGTSRSLIWALHNNEYSRDFHVARNVGRLKKERCTVRRNEVLRDGCAILEYHRLHKSELELVWKGEDGTGLGPTMEFYTMFTQELLRKDLGLWQCDESTSSLTHINNTFGLFPAPYPEDHWRMNEICRLFHSMGVLIGKSMQDNRQLSDMNLSEPLIKILCPPIDNRNFAVLSVEDRINLLTYNDFCIIEPSRSRIFERLDEGDVDDMCISYSYSPSSEHYGYSEYPLDERFEYVNRENLKSYIDATCQFVLKNGIYNQINSLFDGIKSVIDIDYLQCFTPDEIPYLISGHVDLNWSREELLKNIEPKNGYNRNSQTYLDLIEILLTIDDEDRKNVIQFVTGCRTLPVGGLAALTPPWTVARKDDLGYPSVNTCYHFLKIPDYKSENTLKERLLHACLEKGFYFN